MVVNHSPVIEFHQGWDLMVVGIKKLKRILENYSEPPFTSQDYMNLYTTIYNMCTQKPPHDYSQQLYDHYKEVFDEYTTTVVLPWLQEKHDEFMLSELVKSWANHKVMVRWLSRFFHYLDRYFITRRSLPNLNQVGVSSFREHIYEEIKGSSKDAVIALIEKEREGEQIDRSLLKHVLEFFIEIDLEGNLQCYVSDFETHMLDATAGYYSRKSVVWIAEDSCPEYMIKVEEVLRKERERVSHYLHSSTEEKLVEKVQFELLTVYSSQLLEKENSGCRVLLRNDKVDDLSRMYRLFSKIAGGLEPVANMFYDHVKGEGMALVQQAEDAATNSKVSGDKKDAALAELVLIRKVIELHDKYLAYVNNCFGSHALFHKAFKEAFEVFCNKSIAGSSSSELLANFAEDVLKKGGSTEKLSDEAIDQTLDKIVRILVFISDKDLFAEFYRKKLARRLMQEKSGNDDHERSILSKLKQQFGAQYTSKMEGMVTDLALAKENQSAFPEYLNQKLVHLGLDFVVTTLTTGYWPSYKSADLNLPMEIVKAVQVFKEFYDTKTRSRRLTWLHSMSNCQLNGKFQPKTIELQVSAYQAVVLMLFNDADRLSYKEIQVQSNLPDDDLVRILHSLSCAKYKILVKETNSKAISATDTFEFHLKFTDKMRRIRVPLPPLDEKKKVIEDVDKDRRYSIDASLVRIMKSRKVLGYQQLVLECVEQLSRMFKPDIRVIKKRIEDLITRDYLERDAENPNTFKYLA